MAWRLKLCSVSGCGSIAEQAKPYCEKHRNHVAEAARLYRENTPWARWYNWAVWKNLRTLCLARDPLCKRCERAPSTDADHIIPHRGNWDLFTDLDHNLQGLCSSCHSEKTAREDSGFGNIRKN